MPERVANGLWGSPVAAAPAVTVCICTHARPGYVRQCLAGLAAQTVPSSTFETVVVDSGSPASAAAALVRVVAAHPGVRLVAVDRPGVSLARNAAAAAARSAYVAYIDDDAIPASDWIACILRAIAEASPPAAVIGGRILPRWEAPLPRWWPPELRGVLSIIEHQGRGAYRTPALPPKLEPYAANMVVHVPALLRAGGFHEAVGRFGTALLSDEEVQLAWKLQDAGHPVLYDSRIVVHHQIQASRLNPAWLLRRLYWQGASTVVTRRLLGAPGSVWPEAARRVAVAVLFAPVALVPRGSVALLPLRWRLAYALGFLRAAFGWRAAGAAARLAGAPARLAGAPAR
jgi:glycosyltransferase involved in cell wall biosynthesis